MSRDVLPANMTPVLVCDGAERCHWQPHTFVRTQPVGNGGGRQVFACGKCGHEKFFGVIDLRLCGMREGLQ